jgi:hypothetical protein
MVLAAVEKRTELLEKLLGDEHGAELSELQQRVRCVSPG